MSEPQYSTRCCVGQGSSLNPRSRCDVLPMPFWRPNLAGKGQAKGWESQLPVHGGSKHRYIYYLWYTLANFRHLYQATRMFALHTKPMLIVRIASAIHYGVVLHDMAMYGKYPFFEYRIALPSCHSRPSFLGSVIWCYIGLSYVVICYAQEHTLL